MAEPDATRKARPADAGTIVRVPAAIAPLLERLAAESGQTPAGVVAWAILAALERGELPPRAEVERLQCADPTCRRWFARPRDGVGSTQLYCTPVCSARTRQREAKRRMRAASR